MYDLILMTFDECEDVEQIRFVIHQLQKDHAHCFGATVIAKDREGKLQPYPLKEAETGNRARSTSFPIALPENVPDKAFVQDVLDSLPLGGAALFVLVEDDEASAALLTLLMLFSPSALPFFMPEGIRQNGKVDAHLHADLETYQAAIDNLEVLRSDSTEGDVEVVFKAVDDAYDRLVRSIYAEPA